MSITEADVLIDGDDGTIEAVTPREGGPARDGADELDAEDGLVIPGLVNAHTHVPMTLLRGSADDKPLDSWLREDIWPVEAELQAADVAAGARLGIAEMIRTGTTAFGDMYFFMPAVADVVAEAGLRARLCRGCLSVGKDDDQARGDFEAGLAFAREHDGRAGGRVRTMFGPHSLTTVAERYFREYLPQARDADIPVHTHANETGGEVDPILDEHGQRPLAWADNFDLLGPDTYVAHGVHVDDREIDLLAGRETAVAHCPAANMKLASGMAPVREMLDAGVTVGLGTDGPASNNGLDMFEEMRDAAMVGKLAADDASAVGAATAVALATTGSAAALGFESGRIAAGANADLAVLDLDAVHLTPPHDLVSHLVYAARGSDVRHTVCDGQVLMRDRELLTVDEATAREEATERAEALLARAES
jgi:5-methylthioadenosine/S-adenosylhomocysteine deaminase